MKTLDLTVVVAYLVFITLLGVRAGRGERSTDEYFLAGREMPWFIVGVSIIATMLSTITYLSFPGEIFKYGIGYLSITLAYPLVYPVFAYVIIPYLFRLPATSVYEYLEKRYSPGVRTSVALIFVLTRLTWMGGIVYTAAYALAQITGVSIYVLLLVMGLTTTFYTAHGGLRGVIWTDVAQFFLLFGGAVFIPIYIFTRTGSGLFEWWDLLSRAGHTEIQIFSWDPSVRITLVAALIQRFVWTICTHSSDQVAAQRYFSTSSIEQARRSFLVYISFSLLTTLLLGVCGLALFGFYQSASSLPLEQFRAEMARQADAVFPRFIASELPVGVAGLLVAGILAAGMSSLSSGINSFSAVVLVDFLQRFRTPALIRPLVDGKRLSATIGVAVTLAAVGYSAAVAAKNWNLLEANFRLGAIFTGPMAVPFLAGILSRHAGPRAAIAGLFASAAVGVAIVFGQDLLSLEREISFLWIIPATVVVGVALTIGLSVIARLMSSGTNHSLSTR